MTRRGTLGLVFVVALALMAIISASASATSLLPGEAGTTFTTSAGAGEFGEGIFSIKSTSQEGSGEATGPETGKFTTVFKGSKDALGRSCTGLSDTTAGNVTVTGEYKVDEAVEGAKEIPAIVFKINEVHLACGTELIKVKGAVIGHITTATETLVKSVTVELETNGKGDQKWIEALGVKYELKALLGDKNESLTSQKATETITNFLKGGVAKTVLVMPKP